MGAKIREIDGYKLWYSGSIKAKNRVGILVEKELVDKFCYRQGKYTVWSLGGQLTRKQRESGVNSVDNM